MPRLKIPTELRYLIGALVMLAALWGVIALWAG